MRTQVAIIGAGPAGLVLAALLAREGVETVVVEARSREHVESRMRAGVLEAPTVDLLDELGLAARLHREGLVHEGFELLVDGEPFRVDLTSLTGREIVVYGQEQVVRDLVADRLSAGLPLQFETSCRGIGGIDGDRPTVVVESARGHEEIHCDIVVGADGFHGRCRSAVPSPHLRTFVREHPWGWLGILARSKPASAELVYARHDRGFALASMRSPELTRLYLQCPPGTDAGAWGDDQVWDELAARLDRGEGPAVERGEILQKGVTSMRSYVGEPLRFGRLLLVGDAAHIVPPTGAKGMNLAVADVARLAAPLTEWIRGDRTGEDGLDAWSRAALARVWRAQDFSTTMTEMLHSHEDGFEDHRQRAALRFAATDEMARTALARNYVGLPHR